MNVSVAVWSPPFTADGPPIGGNISFSPTSGAAVRTAFAMLTAGWSDEDLPGGLQYAFYSFPSSVQTPIEWHDPNHPKYWTRQGGRLLRAWSSSPSVEGVVFAPGNYLLVARAQDTFGATSAVLAPGPTVVPPTGGLMLAEVEDLLSAASSAGGADELLSAVDVISGVLADVSGGSQDAAVVSALLLDTLEAANSLAEPTSQAIEKAGLVISRLAGAAGGEALGLSGLERAAGSVEETLGVFLQDSTADRLGQGAGIAVLQSLAALDAVVPEGREARLTEAFARQLLDVAGTLARSAGRYLSSGSSRQLRIGSLALTVARAPLESSHAGQLELPGASVPLAAVTAALEAAAQRRPRRLQAGEACENAPLEVHDMTWYGLNPFRHVTSLEGENRFVFANTTVRVLKLLHCGMPLDLHLGAREAMHLNLPAVQPLQGERLQDGLHHQEETKCLRFNDDPDDMYWENRFTLPPHEHVCRPDDQSCHCLAFAAGGAYAAVNFWDPMPTTTTTATSTLTATTTRTTTTIPEPSMLLPILAGIGGTFLCCCCCCSTAAELRRRKRLSRIASLKEDEVTNLNLPEDKLRDAALALEDLRVKAVHGDAVARRHLLAMAREGIPNAQLVSAIEDVVSAAQRHQAERIELEPPLRLQCVSVPPPLVDVPLPPNARPRRDRQRRG